MSRFVNSLKRLYKNNRITSDKISELLSDGRITQEEYEYIVSNE